MRALAFSAVIVFSLLNAKADILANGDFHDGKAHWKGDLHAASDQDYYNTSSIDQPSDKPGVIVKLKSTWTQMSQVFNSHANSFTYSITFQPSTDFAAQGGGFAGAGGGGFPQRPPGMPGQRNELLSKLLGGDYSGNVVPPSGNEILLLVIDTTQGIFEQAHVRIDPSVKGPQTATGTIPELAAHDEKTFYLIFPSGTGSVTLSNVALTPAQKTAPSENTFH